MSHYLVCVAIPEELALGVGNDSQIEALLDDILAPYEECPDCPDYLEYEDRTQEARVAYERGEVRGVILPNGKKCMVEESAFFEMYQIRDEMVFLKNSADAEKRIESVALSENCVIRKKALKKDFASFEECCQEYFGFREFAPGRWGTGYNPNAKWDWWEIGGRFQGEFLVEKDLDFCLKKHNDNDIDGAFRFVDGACKEDICWDEMLRRDQKSKEEHFEILKKAFAEKSTENLGPLLSIIEEGIISWSGNMAYVKDETLEQHKARLGTSDENHYVCNAYAFVDRNGEWHSQGEMGWFGMSNDNKNRADWNAEFQHLLDEAHDGDFLVMVDCHI